MLVATLALLGLAVVSVVIVTSLIRTETDLIEAKTQQAVSRQNALNALNIAIGQLQYTAGNDRVITSPAATRLDSTPTTPAVDSVIHPYWTQVIETTTGNTTFLVSSPTSSPDPMAAIATTAAVRLLGENSADPNDSTQWVTAEKVPLQTLPNRFATSEQTTGYFAYWTGELNTRARINRTDQISAEISNPYTLASNQLTLPRRTATESLFPALTDPDANATQENLSKVLTPHQLYFLLRDHDELQRHYHDFTTFSRSVLSNPIDGGLKINLTDPTYTDAIITPELRQQITPSFYTTGAPQSFQIEGQLPKQIFGSSAEPAIDTLLLPQHPLVVGYALAVGIFHTQSDRRHRIRFHMHTEWLNPYPWDITFDDLFYQEGNRGYVVMVDNLPRIRITNETSGDTFEVDLSDFDENLSYNSENESNFNSWMEFAPLSNPTGPSIYGIDAGHVYRTIEPSPTTQTEGLARTIQEDPNKWRWGGASPPLNTVRPSGYIYGSDTIHIESLEPVKMDITVVPMLGETIAYSENPNDYADRKGFLLKYKNIPFEDIDIRISGNNYSRAKSTDYNRNDYRLAFTFKLKEDKSTFQYLSDHQTLRTPVMDLSDPATSNLFEIPDVAASARGADLLSEQELFWDDTARENQISPNEDETQFHLYDVPILEPLSPGVFSQLHFNGRSHPWVGSPHAATSPLNEVYDRYYFSGTRVSDNWQQDPQRWAANTPAAGLLTNHSIRPLLQSDLRFPAETAITASTGAAYSMIDGGFNIFSASVEAWTAFLKNQFQNNASLTIQNNDSSTTVSSVFSRLPFGSPNISDQLADSAISEPEKRNQLLYRQGIRALDSTTGDHVRLLAENIVTGIRSRISSQGPDSITSLKDFINSGIVDQAIADTDINAGNNPLDAINPGFLRQSDIFSLLGTQMTTRSDTFVIRTYGDAINPRSGDTQARAWCEAVVQRYPEYMIPTDDAASAPTETLNIILGRRFKVISFRWLQSHEI